MQRTNKGITATLAGLSGGTKTMVLMAIVLAVDVAIGFVLFGQMGILLVGTLASLVVLGSGRTPIRVWMQLYRAKRLEEIQAPGLRRVLKLLSERAKIATPELYVMPKASCGAEVMGTMDGSGAIVLHEGSLKQFSVEELGGIVAQKVAHLAHRDVVLIQLVNAMHRLMLTVAFGGFLGALMVAPWGELGLDAAIFVLGLVFTGRMAFLFIWYDLRQERAVAADTTGSMLLGTPRPLMRALAMSFRLSAQEKSGNGWMGFSPFKYMGEEVTEERILSLARLDGADLPWRPLFLGNASAKADPEGPKAGVVIIRAPSVYVTLPPSGPVFRSFRKPPSKNA